MMKLFKPRRASATHESMRLDVWQVWFVYSTYLQRELTSLGQVAVDLVASGLCDSVMINDGTSIWRGLDDKLHVDPVNLTLSRRGARAKMDLPKGAPPYALEGLYTAAAMRYGEQRVFGDDSPVPYLRGLLGPCVLERQDDSGINLYPIIKLYESGVLLVELRALSGGTSSSIDTATFIYEFRRAQAEQYTTAHVPPTLAELAPLVSSEWKTLRVTDRIKLARAASQHREAVAERTVSDKSGDFEHLFCKLPSSEGSTETITDLALLIANTIGYLASEPRSGVKLAVFGQRPLLTTSHWSGRPHVHLLKFTDQADSSKMNEERHRGEYASILAGVSDAPTSFMSENLRSFDDYGIYITRAAQLWVYTPTTLVAPEETLADPNYGHVVYEQEAAAELLEYAYALNKRLEAESGAPATDPRIVAKLRVLLVELATKIDAHVHSGEILDLLRKGYAAMGIPELQERVATLLSARMDLLAHDEEQRTTRWALILSIIFGFLAVPPLASDVVAPLWRLLGWWKPSNADASQLFFITTSATAVLTTVGVTRLLTIRRRHP
jgi:hypothetical protein